jgi:DNA polymerase
VIKLFIDFETRSTVDLKKSGVYRYAEDESSDVWCCAFAVDDGPVYLWHPDVDDRDIRHAIKHSDTVWAHNCQFERVIVKLLMGRRYGWPELEINRCRCTMVMALAMSLPGFLENAAGALGLDLGKDMSGHRLMMQMSRPRNPRKHEANGLYWWDDEDRKQRLYAYCKRDVEVERMLEKRLMPLRPFEQKLWQLDQRINDRGVHVDVPLCNAAKQIVHRTAARLDSEMVSATNSSVRGCSNVAQLIAFCRARGVENVESIAKDQVVELLARDDLPDDVRRALEIRQEAAKASVAKIEALLAGRSRDGRARGLLQYHAASTGRWGGRRYQPQNLPSRDVPEDVDEMIDTILGGDVDLVELLHGPPLTAASHSIRGMVSAPPGKRLIAADLANIEGRVLAWLAGEEWKLDAFRAFDHGRGEDIYKLAYARAFGLRASQVTKEQRQVGKVMELALGYQGGVGAFQTMAKGYGVRIGESYGLMCDLAPEEAVKAEAAFKERGKASGLAQETWVAAEIVKLLWRAAHLSIVKFWGEIEAAAVAAVQTSAQITCGPMKFRKAGSFLWLRLPSGRALCYPYPKLVEKPLPWGGTKLTFQYKGVSSYARKWEEQYAYGGLWAENVTQAVARDVLAESMFRHETAGYPIVLTVHDEEVAEIDEGFGSVKQFEEIMSEVPAWASGLPIAASGWQGRRYRK